MNILRKFQACSVRSVSYTHLDVYKRQVQRCSIIQKHQLKLLMEWISGWRTIISLTSMRLSVPFSLGNQLEAGHCSRCWFSANMRASLSRRSLVFACARWSENTKTKVFADEDHKLNLFSLYRQAYFRKLGDLLQTGYGSCCRFSTNMRTSFSYRLLVFACARWSTPQQ